MPMTARRKGTIAAVVAVPVIALAVLALLWKPRDGFRFLGGRFPLLTTVEGEMGGGGGGYDVHVYCWREDFSTVRARASAELARLGFVEMKPRPNPSGKIDELNTRMSYWTKGQHQHVGVMAGRSYDYKSAMKLPSVDTGWVTVTVDRYLEDGPYVWLRKALPHQEY